VSSTACSCLGDLHGREWVILVMDPHCRWHGDHEQPCICGSTPQTTDRTPDGV